MTYKTLILLPFLLLGAAGPAAAQRQPPKAGALQPIGTFTDWRGYTQQDADGVVCYAYTKEAPSSDSTKGGAAPAPADAVLFVTHLPNRRNSVAVMPGFTYPRDAHVLFEVDGSIVPFFTAGNSAFARDDLAAIEAFKAGRLAEVEAPRANGTAELDRFSLSGFSAAYAAISEACPAH